MKKTVISTIALIFLFSCQQDNPPNPNPTPCTEPTAYFKYKFDGTLVEMNGSLSQNSREGSIIRKEQMSAGGSGTVLTNSNYGFVIQATKNYFYGVDGYPIIKIVLNSPTLSVTTYPTSSFIRVRTFYPQDVSHYPGSSNPGTSFTLIITKLQNGYADGTFSGVINNGTSPTLYQITEGEFRNVKVIQ